MSLKPIVATLAFVSSLLAFLVLVSTGLFLLAVESSGERLSGAFLALAGTLAFAAGLMVLVMRGDRLRRTGPRAIIAAASVLAALPVAALSSAALRFSGLPLDSPTPVLDRAVFAVGIALAIGAAAFPLLAYLRSRGGESGAETPGQAEDLRAAERQLRAALHQDRDLRMTSSPQDEDPPVRRVKGPAGRVTARKGERSKG